MLELVALIGALVLIVWLPIEARKVAGGWVRPKHRGTPDEFRAQYRRQVTMFMWLGVALAVGNLVIAFVEEEQARRMVKLVIAALWAGVGIAGWVARGRLDAAAR